MDNVVVEKSKNFAVRIVNLYKYLCADKQEYVLSKQLVRCGTSIGANIHEAINAQSRADFVSKMNIALKEANETEYWLELLHRTDFISESEYESIRPDCAELCKLLIAIVKTSKSK
jgi:four helix bundle protein